jgi:leader peptidase (prepilin peptidase) / N-methyltransferase
MPGTVPAHVGSIVIGELMLMPDAVYIVFLFALGASIGSFLNVVVWRLPRGESLVKPPSHCPKCDHLLAWYDNIPVFGWIFLRGKCRYCKEPISPRYPIVEAITGLLFVFYYVMFFMVHIGPCAPLPVIQILPFASQREFWLMPTNIMEHWAIFFLILFMISCLLASSLIDAELFIIPESIPWLMAVVGVAVHAIFDNPRMPGALNLLDERMQPSLGSTVAVGGTVGWLISILLLKLGIFKRSFPDGEPSLEIDEELYEKEVAEAKKRGLPVPPAPLHFTIQQVRGELGKEMLFLMPPMTLALGCFLLHQYVPAVHNFWRPIGSNYHVSGFLGAALGALVGALVVWLARILGTLGFGRLAMGLGDVHLMFGVGAILGAGAATVTFFLAPFAGLAIGVYSLLSTKRRQLPFGPYLSLAAAGVVLCYCPIARYLAPGLTQLANMLRGHAM